MSIIAITSLSLLSLGQVVADCAPAEPTCKRFNVPVAGTNPPITRLQTRIYVASFPTDLTVTGPSGGPETFSGLVAGGTGAKFVGPPDAGVPPDVVRVTAHAVGSSAVGMLDVHIDLQSDRQNIPGNACAAATETGGVWQLETTTNITGLCALLWDQALAGQECEAERISPTVAASAGTQICADARPAADVVMVLDRSCSMNSSAGGTGGSKISALRTAVTDFVGTWHSLVDTEAAACTTAPDCQPTGAALNPYTCSLGRCRLQCSSTCPGGGRCECPLGYSCSSSVCRPKDRLGAVLFSSAASDHLALGDFLPATTVDLSGVSGSGLTSMGAGLNRAREMLDAPGGDPDARKVILLMSNGIQNRYPKVEIRPTPPPSPASITDAAYQVWTYGGTGPDQQIDTNTRIYTVTVGLGLAYDILNQQIANASGAFRLSETTDGSMLAPFFHEMLWNLLRFGSYQGLRLYRGQVDGASPWQTTLDVTSTSRSLSFSVLRPAGSGDEFRLIVVATPPGGGPLPPREISKSDHFSLPATPGSWHVAISAPNSRRPIGFDFHAVADDLAVHVEAGAVTKIYGTGDQIVLRAVARSAGEPLLNLGKSPGTTMEARIIAPGESYGEVLADSKVASGQPSGDDALDPAQAKLQNFLAEGGQLAIDDSKVVKLYDDGSHGDPTANDGVYFGQVSAELVGDYRFVFDIRGRSPNGGAFQRQSMESVAVRVLPSVTQDDHTVQVSPTSGGQTVKFTPVDRTAKKHRFGPGYAMYFVFRTATGTLVRPADGLDGSYSAVLPPGDWSLSFDLSMRAYDERDRERPVDPKALVEIAKPGKPCGCGCRKSASAGPNANPSSKGPGATSSFALFGLLVLFAIRRRRKK